MLKNFSPVSISFLPGICTYWSKWHYTQGTVNPQLHTFKTIESIGDTLINGAHCRILIEAERYSRDIIRSERHFFYSRNDSVFFFQNDQFHLLYDFGAIPDETITLGYFLTYEKKPLTLIIDSLRGF
jgi:hypothetical protein